MDGCYTALPAPHRSCKRGKPPWATPPHKASLLLNQLQKQPELQVIGEVSDGLEAVQKAQELQPDLILLDIGLPSLNGLEVARRIGKVSPASRILFVSENRSADIAEEALSTGASGYVVKSDAGSELLPAVKAVLEGRRFISASLASHFLVAMTLSTIQTTLSWMVMLISGLR
jgi:DNA-binding NarL/FixJ family response regulator